MTKRLLKVLAVIAMTLGLLIPAARTLAVDGEIATYSVGGYVYNDVDYSPVFNLDYYSVNNPDVVSYAKGNPAKILEHFVLSGMSEGRRGSEAFDVSSYRRANGDLRANYGTDLKKYYIHYIEHGRFEGRRGSKDIRVIIDPVSNFRGIDLSSVYDFNEYVNNYPDLYKLYWDDDIAAITHFVQFGVIEGRVAKSGANAYVLERLKQISTALVPKITAYKGIDLSPVFDNAYYLWNNPDVANAVGGDPVKAIEHFVKNGIQEGRAGRAVYNQVTLNELKTAVDNANQLENQMAEVANGYSSPTDYIILVNKAAKQVVVFTGSKGSYSVAKSFSCAIGARSSPTPNGVYNMGHRGLYFNTGTAGRCWYYTQIKGNYLFHSQIYDRQPKPVRLIDSRMSQEVSHGCIRLHLENAKWLYDNIPQGTTIVVY